MIKAFSSEKCSKIHMPFRITVRRASYKTHQKSLQESSRPPVLNTGGYLRQILFCRRFQISQKPLYMPCQNAYTHYPFKSVAGFGDPVYAAHCIRIAFVPTIKEKLFKPVAVNIRRKLPERGDFLLGLIRSPPFSASSLSLNPDAYLFHNSS